MTFSIWPLVVVVIIIMGAAVVILTITTLDHHHHHHHVAANKHSNKGYTELAISLSSGCASKWEQSTKITQHKRIEKSSWDLMLTAVIAVVVDVFFTAAFQINRSCG
jgi:purine-cytosine permease-like protein